MNKKNILFALTLLTTGTVLADELPKDSLKVVDIEEVVVIATPKENRKLREQPTAVTLLSQQDMRANQVKSVKNLTALVPNIFIPDYGSKLTTSIYIRGIGSRINTPSVGLYVDNIPYIDKSAFDFNYADIERIDVLRGPQGTLYGRNTMGGLIKVHTKSPFTYQGTDLRLGAATYNDYNVSLTHYHRMSERFAFSTGGFYEHTGGFFKNAARGNERIDRSNAGGGRFRGIYLPTENLKVDMTLSYEYGDQGGYPYIYTGMVNGQTETRPEYIGKISYNDRSSYYRGLLNAGVNIEYHARNFTLSAITGFQNLKDRMFLDQDFTEQDIFNIAQKQRSNTLSEEIVLKSKPNKRWQWATGAFALYQWLDTDGPVTFKKDGMANMERGINQVFPTTIPGKMRLELPEQMLISGRFKTPVLSAAIYHQSTIKDLFVKGLSGTIGLRLDYEKNTMKYNSGAEMPSTFSLKMQMGPTAMNITQPVDTYTGFEGKLSNDYLQLLPKFALQYDFDTRNNIYASVSKGYRSGGYNIQMFSDLLQNNLSNDMQSDLKRLLLAREDIDPNAKAMISKFLNPGTNITDVKSYTLYKPEYSWNYEIGSHLTLLEGKLWLDLAAFYMDTRNQQVSKFAESGLGRITENAGKSRSYGGEASIRASLTNSLSLNANYGYTYATFTDYVTNRKEGKELVSISYTGKYVPFVPKHTMSVGGQYIFFISPRHWLDRIELNANYTGAGRIYWTEQNNVSQAFYGTLNSCLTMAKGNGAITFWVRNALDRNYAAFYFETMNKGFEQRGKPLQAGIELRCRF